MIHQLPLPYIAWKQYVTEARKAMTNSFDYLIVGSGINSLVCGAMLAKKGFRVALLERNDQLGGCIRTEALTLPALGGGSGFLVAKTFCE